MIVIKKTFIYILFIFSIIFCISSVFADETIKYGTTKELVPTFGDSFGGTANEVASLSDGGYVITGHFQNNIQVGNTTLTCNGGEDVLVVRYNSNNEIVSATSFGGTRVETGRSITSLPDGGYVVTGYFMNSMQVGNTTLTSNGGNDIFIVRYNSNNEIVSATSFGGTKSDVVSRITSLPDGGYVVIGSFQNSMQVGNTTLTSNSGNDIFIVRYNSNNEAVSATSFGGTANGVASLSDGGYVITGSFQNSIQVGNTTLTSNGGTDPFIVKYNSNNEVVSATSFGGADADAPSGISALPDGGYVVIGQFQNSMQVGNTTLTSNGGNDIFIVRYNSNNEAVSATSFGGTVADASSRISALSDGGYVVTGSFQNSMQVGNTILTSNGRYDPFIVRYNSNNEAVGVLSFGGTAAETGSGISVLPDGGYITIGSYMSSLQVGNVTLSNPYVRGNYVIKLKEYDFIRTIDFTKEDKDTKEKLKNAKFVVRKADINKYYIDNLTFGDKKDAKVFTSDENGDFNIDFKVNGIYYLEEVESPAGYRKNDYSYIIEVKQNEIKVIEANNVQKNNYVNNLPTDEFTTKTSELVDENKKDRYQKNYQEISKNGYSIKKQAEWTDIENGKAKITIKIKRPPLVKEDEELNTRVIYALTTCTAHGFSYELAKRNINQLLKNYDTVDLIIANGPSINDLVTIKNVKKAETALKDIKFDSNQHWGINLYTGLQNYLKNTTPDVVYTSFDLLTLTKDGDKYTDESAWNKLKEYENKERYYSLVGNFRYDEVVSNKLGWKTIAGLVSPKSWNGFAGTVDLDSLKDIPFSYENDFRTLNIDVDPNSKKENVSKSVFEDIVSDNLSITDVNVTDNASYKVNANQVKVDLTDVDVDKEVTVEIYAEINEESADSDWFNTNKGEATLEETRRVGREYKPKETLEVSSPKLAELGYTYDGSEITANNGVYTIGNEKINKHSFTIKKVDGITNTTLTEAEFILEGKTDYGKEVKISKKTNGNGILTFNEIEEGEYTLTETKAPSGYENSIQGLKVKVQKDGVKIYGLSKENETFIAKNYELENIVIKKINEEGEVLKGAIFKVYGHTTEGKKIDKEYTTNEEGIIELEEGTYTVKEVKAPDGYVLSGETFFLDKENNYIEIINNKIKGRIIVTKKWSELPDNKVHPEIIVQGKDKDGNIKYHNTTENDVDKWVKDGKIWTYTFEISDLNLEYIAWEEEMSGYISSNTDANPLKIKLDGENIITNTKIKKHDLELTKEVVGSASSKEDEFDFTIKIYDRDDKKKKKKINIIINGKEKEIMMTEKGFALKLKGGEKVIFKDIETGYKYEIKEKDTDYIEYHLIEGIKSKTKSNKVSGKLISDIKVKFINEKEKNSNISSNDSEIPNTGDNINTHVWGLFISLIGLVLSSIYLIKNQSKKCNI